MSQGRERGVLMAAPTEPDFSSLQQEILLLKSVEPDNTYLLYAMGLRLATMDYYALHLNNLLDRPDDKKIDFFNIDNDYAVCTIAQGYFSEDWSRREPPATKASDLNTAMAWLFESEITGIPRPEVRACAEQLRDGLNSGDVLRVEIFYVHNLPSSANVDAELGTVRRTTSRLLQRYERGSIAPECDVTQASREVVEQWRRTQHEAISVHDTITLPSSMTPQVLETAEWRAAIGTVSVDVLVALRLKYGDALTSANVRDYLGTRESSRNINRQIQKTVIDEPNNFWIYNNGITVLTNGIHVDGNNINLSGFSIINGAQTTGSLSEAATQRPLRNAHVLVRAIKCNDRGLIDTVIRYNNTQNPIKAWEEGCKHNLRISA